MAYLQDTSASCLCRHSPEVRVLLLLLSLSLFLFLSFSHCYPDHIQIEPMNSNEDRDVVIGRARQIASDPWHMRFRPARPSDTAGTFCSDLWDIPGRDAPLAVMDVMREIECFRDSTTTSKGSRHHGWSKSKAEGESETVMSCKVTSGLKLICL